MSERSSRTFVIINNNTKESDYMQNKPRMRSIPQAYKELKRNDPDTCISERLLRKMVSNGDIPTVKIEHKTLLNMDLLLEILSCKSNNSNDVSCV